VSTPAAPAPDDKDWTWVLDRPCPECGFDAAAFDRSAIGATVRSVAATFGAALARPDARERPQPTVWSVLEYGCHVRDVFTLYAERLQLMLDSDDPMFANWNQDDTALAERYWAQDPATVAREVGSAGSLVAAAFDAVSDEQWQHSGRRSDGAVFSVDTFGRYFVHDLVHHVHDISPR
jgi:hypothetical protein